MCQSAGLASDKEATADSATSHYPIIKADQETEANNPCPGHGGAYSDLKETAQVERGQKTAKMENQVPWNHPTHR